MTIIILAEPDDVHALSVQSCAQRELASRTVILDAAGYPRTWHATVEVGSYKFSLATDQGVVASDEITGVWRRRVRRPEIDPAVRDVDARAFSRAEAQSFLSGLFANCVNVMNSAAHEDAAASKVRQLKAAVDAGLNVPETLITTDADAVKAFYSHHGRRVIFKVLGATPFQFSETRALRPQDLELLYTVRFAPTIFQRCIMPRSHLRVTVVDNAIFAASIETARDQALLDWRLDPTPTIRAVELDAAITERLLQLLQRLGLRYAAIDMIVAAEDGKAFFLEANPGGQFLFVEVETRQPISLTVAKALAHLT